MDYCRTYVRVLHIPTGICAACNNERSPHRNKAAAMAIVKARLYAAMHIVADREAVVRSYELPGEMDDVIPDSALDEIVNNA